MSTCSLSLRAARSLLSQGAGPLARFDRSGRFSEDD